MKHTLKVIIFLIGVCSVHGQTPQWLWAQEGGGDDIVVDGLGNILVAVDDGTSGDDLISKYDENGNLIWTEQADGVARRIAVDASGNYLVTGTFEGIAFFGDTNLVTAGGEDIFLAKYDGAGNLLWVEQAGGQWDDVGRGVTVDASGGDILLTGDFWYTSTFGDTALTSEGDNDFFLAKYDGNGNLRWIKQTGGSELDRGLSIAVDESGNSLVAGDTFGGATFGDTTLTDPAIFIAKYDMNGKLVWVETGEYIRYIEDIAVDGFGNCFITGSFTGTATFGDTTLTSIDGTPDVFVTKYDGNGNWIWTRQAGGASGNHVYSDAGQSIAVDNSGNSLITGYFSETAIFGDTILTSAGGYDVFVSKYDADGNMIWTEQVGGEGGSFTSESGRGIAVDASGNALVSGRFFGPAAFGDTTIGSYQSRFIAKIGDVTTGIETTLASPNNFRVHQNYPNPFNPATTIKYQLPKSAQVELTVYNLLGQKVITLVSAFQTAGEKSVVWDGTNAAEQPVGTGIYFYSLQTGDFTDTRKMLLVR